MKHWPRIFTIWGILSLLIACQKEENASSSLPLEQQMNQFIEKSMKSIYLWADQVKGVNPDLDQEPEDFLHKLRYQEDQWSYLEEDETATRSTIDGKEKTFGYQIQFYRISEEIVGGMILYVYENSPAANAGLKRGDLIMANNGKLLTEENYTDILNEETLTLKTGIIYSDTLFLSNQDYTLSQATIEQNPILLDTILRINNKKIGYLVYSHFYDNQSTHLPQLTQTIGNFKKASIDEFILDLRYNTGGAETAAQHLSSLLAPAKNVQQEDILIHKQWNSTYQNRMSSNQLGTRLKSELLAENLDLQKIYILTSEHTASASEVVISGLRPYIPHVILVGTSTYGKYVGMHQLSPSEELKKWTLWPVTFCYTNANGESVKGGISPTYTVQEYDNYLPPFGSLTDPLLYKTLELINGTVSTLANNSRSNKNPMTNHWQSIGKIEVHPLIGQSIE